MIDSFPHPASRKEAGFYWSNPVHLIHLDSNAGVGPKVKPIFA